MKKNGKSEADRFNGAIRECCDVLKSKHMSILEGLYVLTHLHAWMETGMQEADRITVRSNYFRAVDAHHQAGIIDKH